MLNLFVDAMSTRPPQTTCQCRPTAASQRQTRDNLLPTLPLPTKATHVCHGYLKYLKLHALLYYFWLKSFLYSYYSYLPHGSNTV